MGKLIKSEFRKILSTKLWWGLMIASVLLAGTWAGVWAGVFESITSDVDDEVQQLNVRLNEISFSSVFLTRAVNISTIFPMLFGGLALASEIGRKTITTSFLTASNRAALLGAKAITYVIWGALFGVAIILSATLGLLIGTGGTGVAFGVWLPIAGAGILSCVLWTLLGLGVGALIGSPIGTSIVLLIYGLVLGPVSDLVLTGFAEGEPNLTGALPNGSANGLTGATASETMVGEIRDAVGNSPLPENIIENFEKAARLAAGGLGSFGLWASAAIFLGWALAFFGIGLARTQTRDIT